MTTERGHGADGADRGAREGAPGMAGARSGEGAGPADDAILAPFLAAARGSEGRPETLSPELFARILADAVRIAEPAPTGSVVARRAPRRGFWGRLVAALGGWPAMAGLASAVLVGVWVGFASPDDIEQLAPFGTEYSLADLLSGAWMADGI